MHKKQDGNKEYGRGKTEVLEKKRKDGRRWMMEVVVWKSEGGLRMKEAR